MKVAICLPVYSSFRDETTLSLVGMSLYSAKQLPEAEIFGAMASGCQVPLGRNALAENALNKGADWLLWVDSDMTFPEDALVRLLSHNLPFVGANYLQRRLPEPTASRLVGGRYQRVTTSAESPLLEAVDIIGFGLCVTSASLFRRLARPWFADGPNGEDGYFCEKTASLNVRPQVDHVLSRDCGHIAQTVLTFPR